MLLAIHPFMVVTSALQTVPFTTAFAIEEGGSFIEFVDEVAVGSGTPGGAVTVVFHVLIEGEIVIFLL
jgi:hypothetical protein